MTTACAVSVTCSRSAARIVSALSRTYCQENHGLPGRRPERQRKHIGGEEGHTWTLPRSRPALAERGIDQLENIRKAVPGRHRRRRRPQPGGAGRRAGRADRPVRLRQVHRAAHDQPADRAVRRPDPARRRGRHRRRPGRAAPPDRLRHPERRPLPAPDDPHQRRHGAPAARLAARRGSATAPTSCSTWSASTRRGTAAATRTSSPAASGSGSAWPGRSPPTRVVLLMDEPFSAVDPIVRGPAAGGVPAAAGRRSARPSCWSPTTSTRRSGSATGSRCSSEGGRLEQYATPAELLGDAGVRRSSASSSAPTAASGGWPSPRSTTRCGPLGQVDGRRTVCRPSPPTARSTTRWPRCSTADYAARRGAEDGEPVGGVSAGDHRGARASTTRRTKSESLAAAGPAADPRRRSRRGPLHGRPGAASAGAAPAAEGGEADDPADEEAVGGAGAGRLERAEQRRVGAGSAW